MKLPDNLFALIQWSLEEKELLVRKGTVEDATIIPSVNRPLSKEKRATLEKNPFAPVDTDAHSTVKKIKKILKPLDLKVAQEGLILT